MSNAHLLPVRVAPPAVRQVHESAVHRLLEVGSLEQLVAILLSRFVGERRALNCADMAMLERVLVRFAHVAGAELDAKSSARHFTVVREHGFSRETLRLRWRQRRGEHGVVAVLDPELLQTLFAAPVWRSLALLIVHGPAGAAALADQMLHREASREVKPTRLRPEGGLLSQATLQNYAWVLNWVMGTLVDLRKRGVLCPELEAWTHSPRVSAPEAPAANTDTSAPSWRLVRLAWQSLDHEIKQRLGAHSDQHELEIVRTCSPVRLRLGGVWMLMRRRAMFALCAMLGGRVEALTMLRRADFKMAHQCPDGQVTPAIALRPHKASPDGEVHYKPIPPASTWCLEVLLIATDRILAETPDYTDTGRITRPAPPEDLAMFPTSLRKPGRSMRSAGFRAALVGRPARGGRQARAPMLPRQNGTGHTPHNIRSAVMQMLEREALRYCEQQRLPYRPQDIPEALVNHGGMADDRHGYYDRNTLPGREILSRIATCLAWPALTTDHGARQIRNANAYRTALKQERALHQELDILQADITATMASASDPRRAATVLLQIRALDEQRDTIRTRLADVQGQIERLRHDPATMVPVPDDLPDEELADEFEQIERKLAAPRSIASRRAAPEAIRAFLTIPELAVVLEVSYPTAARWANGQHTPYPAGDPRNPLIGPIDSSLGPRRRRIPLSSINPTHIAAEAQRHRLAQICSEAPEGWRTEHWKAPPLSPLLPAVGFNDDPATC